MNILKKTIQVKHHSGFRKYFANTSWLLGEKILRMVVALFLKIQNFVIHLESLVLIPRKNSIGIAPSIHTWTCLKQF